MNIILKRGLIQETPSDLLILAQCSDQPTLGGAALCVDEHLHGHLAQVKKEEAFSGKSGESLLVRCQDQEVLRRFLFVGLGKRADLCEEVLREAMACAYHSAKVLKAKNVTTILHGAGAGEMTPRASAKAIAEGWLLASYSFDRYKKPKKDTVIPELTVVIRTARTMKMAQAGADLGMAFAQATCLARDLVNTPAQDMLPADLVQVARDIAKEQEQVSVRVFDRTALKKMGAGGILGVSQGSDHDPYLVEMHYTPKKPSKKHIFLVGKAVTFDSGGLSIKPAQGMETMKCDMAGAAAVLGAFSAITHVAPNAHVHGVFGAVENAISGNALRPGDVITVLNGKTIEVLNTDAEGRLTLADTISYAAKQNPDVIIDLATLTGACVVALGEEVTGLMSNNDLWSERVLTAAKSAGENMWRLPLLKSYKRLLKSSIADYRNISTSRYGGALTAGLFLEPFVGKTPWVHLDIAGPAFAEKKINSYTTGGGTGHGVRTLLTLLKTL